MSNELAPSPFPADYVPRIHRAEALEVIHLTPGMVRVRFGGSDLADYPTTGVGDEYVRVFFPDRPHDEPRLPFITSIRGWDYPAGTRPSEMRVYTIRAHTQGEVVIDFVTHQGGVAASWALAAMPGDAVGINPPCALYDRPERLDTQILVADEPGLPAALRIAEESAPSVRTMILAEVRDPAHLLEAHIAGIEYRWLMGHGNGDSPSRVLEELRSLPIDEHTYVWAATEGGVNRAIRRHLRHERGLAADHYKCVAYWQQRAEERRAKLAALGEDFVARVHAVREQAGDEDEAADDAVEALYESVGL